MSKAAASSASLPLVTRMFFPWCKSAQLALGLDRFTLFVWQNLMCDERWTCHEADVRRLFAHNAV